tara:strand:- start:70780 stop:71178 length:399 start_codon:yes stop_codon:yes gene_type:complete
MERNYTAFVVREDDSYIVSFPDLPGCITFAGTMDEAYGNARDLLPVYLEAMRDNGREIPLPTPFEDAQPDADEADLVVGKILVPAKMPGVMVRTNISLDSYLLESVDRITTNRSAFFADLAEREIRKRTSAA